MLMSDYKIFIFLYIMRGLNEINSFTNNEIIETKKTNDGMLLKID